MNFQPIYHKNVDSAGRHISTTVLLYHCGQKLAEVFLSPGGTRTMSVAYDPVSELPISKIDYKPDGLTAAHITRFDYDEFNRPVAKLFNGQGQFLRRVSLEWSIKQALQKQCIGFSNAFDAAMRGTKGALGYS
jgi:hypothetical protein